jgi:catalytic LigB subunit of aromatic ring-opening dioxygenase
MAEIVLGIGTSHTPIFSLPPELWAEYAEADKTNPELVFPPKGYAIPYQEAVAHHVPDATRKQPRDISVFRKQAHACEAALDELARTLQAANPDVTLIISDDQDEWFYDANMPALAVYWGETAPLIPRQTGSRNRSAEISKLVGIGYGDRRLEVPVDAAFGRFIIEALMDQDFDVAQLREMKQPCGGEVTHRYPTAGEELQVLHDMPLREQGLPHGFAFIVKRLFGNHPGPIVPIIQNTCYPPNSVTPRRAYQLGEALAHAISEWREDVRVAVVASGGLSHFVVDEEIDQEILRALSSRDERALLSLPRERLRSGTSESLNWVALGGVVAKTELRMELLDYIASYRTEAGTGGGWAFARWLAGRRPH